MARTTVTLARLTGCDVTTYTLLLAWILIIAVCSGVNLACFLLRPGHRTGIEGVRPEQPKTRPSGATEPQFAVSREHLLDAYNKGLCVQVEA